MKKQVGTVTITQSSLSDDAAFYLTCNACDWGDERWNEDMATESAERHDYRHSFITEGMAFLRFLSDHAEARSDLLTRYVTPPMHSVIYISDDSEWNEATKEWETEAGSAARKMAAIATELGGRWEKHTTEHYFTLSRSFGPHTISLESPRDAVCTKRVVGTEEKEVRKVKEYETVTETVEVVEWDCPPSLLALSKTEEA